MREAALHCYDYTASWLGSVWLSEELSPKLKHNETNQEMYQKHRTGIGERWVL